jgi:predicted site-specific integrase-resolvase
MSVDSTPNRLLTSRRLCERYNVVLRTIDRWMEQGHLPPPLIINTRRYWDEEQLARFERERMKRPSKAVPQPAETDQPTAA